SAHVARWVESSAKELGLVGVEFEVVPLAEYHLPVFDAPVSPMALTEPFEDPAVASWGRKMGSFAAYILVTPEYNHSVPGAMKNAIDWASRPWGQSSFAGKPAAIVGASMGPLGTTQAQSQLRNVLLYLDMKVMGQPEVYFNAITGLDEQGHVVGESREFIKSFAEAFVAHVRSAASAR
ncbi:NADPH-dependent FMN reductase, partial [Bifidobacterium mongoliense]|uniref:NADPH-dependent FMN reductase n=1 Tax=Bifidobacterium mongoliense TaxID=518643 RepID=UPI00264804FA